MIRRALIYEHVPICPFESTLRASCCLETIAITISQHRLSEIKRKEKWLGCLGKGTKTRDCKDS